MKTFTQWYAEHKHLNFGEAKDCYADYEHIHRPLSYNERVALVAFIKEYGREWKGYLAAAWASHRYKGEHMAGCDVGVLRQIRNDRGPSWLSEFNAADIGIPQPVLPAVGDEVAVVTNFGQGPTIKVKVIGHGEKNGKRLIDYVDDGNRRWAYLSQIVRG